MADVIKQIKVKDKTYDLQATYDANGKKIDKTYLIWDDAPYAVAERNSLTFKLIRVEKPTYSADEAVLIKPGTLYFSGEATSTLAAIKDGHDVADMSLSLTSDASIANLNYNDFYIYNIVLEVAGGNLGLDDMSFTLVSKAWLQSKQNPEDLPGAMPASTILPYAKFSDNYKFVAATVIASYSADLAVPDLGLGVFVVDVPFYHNINITTQDNIVSGEISYSYLAGDTGSFFIEGPSIGWGVSDVNANYLFGYTPVDVGNSSIAFQYDTTAQNLLNVHSASFNMVTGEYISGIPTYYASYDNLDNHWFTEENYFFAYTDASGDMYFAGKSLAIKSDDSKAMYIASDTYSEIAFSDPHNTSLGVTYVLDPSAAGVKYKNQETLKDFGGSAYINISAPSSNYVEADSANYVSYPFNISGIAINNNPQPVEGNLNIAFDTKNNVIKAADITLDYNGSTYSLVKDGSSGGGTGKETILLNMTTESCKGWVNVGDLAPSGVTVLYRYQGDIADCKGFESITAEDRTNLRNKIVNNQVEILLAPYSQASIDRGQVLHMSGWASSSWCSSGNGFSINFVGVRHEVDSTPICLQSFTVVI